MPGVREVCYSLPRVITMGVQCTFCAYMWELYTAEFGWTQAEYGIVSLLYSATQVVLFILLGLAFNFGINRLNDNEKLWASKGILAGGTFFHWLTYLFLIILPIKWHGVKTPYVDSMLGKQSKFFRVMFGGPVPLSTMASSWFWWIIFGFFWFFVKLFWIPLYLPMKVCFLCGRCCMGLLRIIHSRRTKITSILPVLETLESIPPPACSACCNTTCCNALLMRLISWKRWLKTRRGFICLLTVAHGFGVSMHEISNGAIRSYIYKDGGLGSGALNMNLTFFFISNLLVYLLFSLLKFHVRAKAFFADTFYLLTILFFVLMIPALIFFFWKTEKDDAGESKGFKGPTECLVFKFLSATVFHSTVVFFIFSSGPLTFYLGVFIMGGHVMIGSFGLLIINLAMTIASWAQIYGGLTTFDHKKQMIVTGTCIICGVFAFMLLYPQDWRWNIWHWFNYLIMIAIGIVNSIFVTYANIMMGNISTEARGKNLQWIFFGLFYSLTNAVVSPSMNFMFKSMGQDRQAGMRVSCIQIILDYCFPGFYKAILMLFIVANAIALYIYCTCHYLDKYYAALYKFADNLNDLTTKALAFQTAAGPTGNGFLQKAGEFGNHANGDATKFKAMASAFKMAAEKFQELADGLAMTLSGTVLEKEAIDFNKKAGDFATEANNFNSHAQDVGVPDRDNDTSYTTSLSGIKTKFQNQSGADKVAYIFGNTSGGSSDYGAAKKLYDAFNTFASGIATPQNRTLAQLKSKLTTFKGNTGIDGFKDKATAFNTAAQITVNNAGKTQDAIGAFTRAAGHFGNTGGAAEKLKELADQLYRISKVIT